MRVLVTGATGFVGLYMIEYLDKLNNIEVYGTAYSAYNPKMFKNFKKKPKILKVDLLNKKQVDDLIKKSKPQYIIHLAGLSIPGDSWENAEEIINNNIIGQLHLLDSIKQNNPKTKVLIISSAQVYGAVKPTEVPVLETNELRPNNSYAVSKLSQEFLSKQYFYNYGLPIIILRPCNHIGPRQGKELAISSFAKQIVDIESGEQKNIIKVGNLEPERDFLDVRDVVKAYWVSLEKCEAGEVYNLASGKAHKIKDLLKLMLDMTSKKIKIEKDETRMRPTDIPIFLGNYNKFHKATEWKPDIGIDQTLKDILNYWRENNNK